MKNLIIIFMVVFYFPGYLLSQTVEVYKNIGAAELTLTFYYPEKFDSTKSYPAMVFFFGGGWIDGGPEHFAPQSQYLAGRGIVGICADYRTSSRFGTTPFESLMDAKSAIRFIRKNATRIHVDPAKLIACGGSAGGHLAAACALIKGYNEPEEDTLISSRPAALVLFNPVIDNGPGGYGFERIGESYRYFSPLHNIAKGAPPTIIFLGTNDSLVPVETVKYYQKVMEKVGSRCDLFLYPGEGHGFFNFGKPYFDITISETEFFLVSLGYISG